MPYEHLIIDCDPGVDDAIALLLALASPELVIRGITTVAGNVPLVSILRNTRQICELAARPDVPVYAGCPRPMLRRLATAESVHGTSGLGGAMLPAPTMPIQPHHAVDFLTETLSQTDQPLTLATLAPLTNMAVALIKTPAIAPQIQRIVMMGGSLTVGNITPSAEFNIYVDPHAAHVVLTSGIPITLIGLHVTHQVLTTPDRLQRLRHLGTPVAQAAADMLAEYGTQEAAQRGWSGPPLHDPCVIAYLLQPGLFSSQPAEVQVEINSELTLGRTVIDFQSRQPNAEVVTSVDAEGFYDLLIDRLARY
ncbi:MAG: nucleoside hydrolase [Cyanobacteria bacterium]|nr:nucleoside hydrolase [Cyanobacteriota bacterium]MDW8201879.1 nucleoside hydrolase [Cyanobacteriota bacterium SKYGB_h_bin112]